MKRSRPAVILVAALCAAGCAPKQRTVEAAFPQASEALPFVLREQVWTGPAEQAAAALGDDWQKLQPLNPSRAWLAVYEHRAHPDQIITVRAFEFESAEQAGRAYDSWQPMDARALKMGDRGCWTDVGVMFLSGRVFFDVFGNDAGWGPQMQAVFLASCIEKRLPAPADAAKP